MIKEVLTSVRKTCIWAMVPIGMLAAFSCQDDMLAERQPVIAGDEISFMVASDSAIAARSVASAQPVTHRQFLTTIGKDSLFLYTTIEENTDQPFEQSGASRAASNTTASLSTFYVDALYNSKEQFMNGTKVSRENSQSPWTYSPLKYWPNNEGDYVDFYGYTTVPNSFAWLIKHKSFEYTLPSAAGNQQDLIFAQALKQTKQNVNGSVNLHFYHALSAVLFKIGTLPEDISLDNLTVTLNNVKSEGTCEISNANNALSFSWDDEEVTESNSSNYSQTFTKTGKFGNEEELSDVDEETAFMMIPHTFAEDASMDISFKIGDVEYSFNHSLVIGNNTGWNPNTKYTYTLTINEYVEVEIEEELPSSSVKENVKFKNTGLSDVKMRAAIVGYWVVDEAQDIVLPWDINNKTQGEVTWGTGWSKGENDDFYYYNSVVKPGKETTNLFNRYELIQDPPVAGAKLILNVVVQAVAVEEFNGENAPW